LKKITVYITHIGTYYLYYLLLSMHAALQHE